ncbi:hypothetical protein [Streptomyces europaeiscabiei]
MPGSRSRPSRYTREQVAQIAAQYKPRKDEYKAVRAVLIAA